MRGKSLDLISMMCICEIFSVMYLKHVVFILVFLLRLKNMNMYEIHGVVAMYLRMDERISRGKKLANGQNWDNCNGTRPRSI